MNMVIFVVAFTHFQKTYKDTKKNDIYKSYDKKSCFSDKLSTRHRQRGRIGCRRAA